ncbi:Nucleotidyltransferase domain protein [Aphelenchoides bicaudatus]|nr:Nucleotidyltransferase domain protein [Aphelenchoides bicaudatus]
MKESLGFKTVKILDAIQDINIFDVRTEHAIFLDNMIFFACAEFLHLPNTLTYQNIAVESIGSFFRDSGYPFLVFTNDQSKISNLGNFFSRGFGSWNPSVIPRIESKCYFCHQIGHTEKRCPILKIVPIDNANPISSAMHDIFTRVIGTNYTAERLTEQHLKTAEDFIKQVESIVLARQGIRIQLKQFGSLKSGFGTNRSDLDLCIDLDDINLKNVDEKEKRAASIQLLQKIGDSLSADGRFDVSYVFGARVPILKFKYTGEDGTKFKADICCSNELALINTQLLATYASFDERVAPLCVAIKRWASVFAINDAAQHTFSSYSLAVMLIHFLQRVEPPVLPYLQDADAFGLESKMVDDQFEVSFARPNVDFMGNFRKNGMSLGQLFTAFFDYYNIFDWQDQVIQIRNSSSLYKFDKEWTRSTVSIEDPFELPHNLVGGIRTSDYLIIRKSINIMQHEFRNSKSIFYQSDFTFTSKNYYYLRAPIQRSNVNAPACHNCGETGHYKASCPNEKKKPGATPSNNRSNFRTPNGRTRSQNFASTSRQQNFVPTSRQQNGNDQSKVKFFN